jgi:hypothetical protein
MSASHSVLKLRLLTLCLLLAILFSLAALSAQIEDQDHQVTLTPWETPVLVTNPPDPTQTPGWWDPLPTPIPFQTPTPRK